MEEHLNQNISHLNVKNEATKIQKVKLSKNFMKLVESPEIYNSSNKAYRDYKLMTQDEEGFDIGKFIINEFFSSQKSEEISKRLQKSKDDVYKIESEIIKRISGKINLEGNKKGELSKKETKGSLYDLFDSYFFTIHLLICYLDKKEEIGILDTLVNLIYKKYIHDSFFYLPQICMMISYKPHFDSLENFLLDRCIGQMKFSLIVYWLITSYLEDDEMKSKKKFETLAQRIETTLVNGTRATVSISKQYLKTSQNLNEEEVILSSITKQIRLDYFQKVIEFYENLKFMCEKLHTFPREPKEIRNNLLRNYMMSFNMQIKSQRDEMKNDNSIFSRKSPTKNFYNGIILPFDDSKSTLDEYNSLIVRIVPSQCFCFSTKARVPAKVTCEIVKVIECEYWDDLFIEEDDDHFYVNDNEIKTISKEIEIEKKNKMNMNRNKKHKKEEKQDNEYKNLNDYFEKIKSKESKSKLTQNVINDIKEVKKDNEVCLLEYNEDNNPFGKKWSDICDEVKEKSPYRKFESYSIKSFIAKANDDLRQELLAMQLIKRFQEIFKEADIPLKLRPYDILITSSSSGLIEFLPNTISIDGLKKKIPSEFTLNTFYRSFFKNSFEEAQKNFVESLAAYSLIAYIMQIKDRHNGNILIDMNGCIIHIDFGFILGISPGNLNFENAPFKLTLEYVDIMDGVDSPMYHYFRSLLLRGYMELRKHVDSFVKIVEVMAKGSKMPCFPPNTDIQKIITLFRDRFYANKSESEFNKILNDLINNSYNNWRIVQYDKFQKITNDIRP